MIHIDGSYGEGGGQIVRTSVSLSSLALRPVRIFNIRKKRAPPGLKNQHMHAIKLLSRITRAETENLRVGSTEIFFKPVGIFGGAYEENIGTAGSITLLLQAVLLPVLFADKEVELKIVGGTDVKHSPSLNYFRYVILPYFERLASVKLTLEQRGFYPKGGGVVSLKIKPRIIRNSFSSFGEFLSELRSLEPLDLTKFNEVWKIEVYSVASKELKARNVAERMLESFLEKLPDFPVKTHVEYVPSLSPGAVITCVIQTDKFVCGADALGERGKTSEEVGEELYLKVKKIVEAKTIDDHLSDNLIPLLALLGGEMEAFAMTGHLETNIWTCEQFLGKIFSVSKKDTIRISVKVR